MFDWKLTVFILAILANSMYGVSLVGSDISSTCTGELYIRWLQLAAFFPLLKNTSIAASKTVSKNIYITSYKTVSAGSNVNLPTFTDLHIIV